jgi:signal recognition particle GTPase
VQVQEVNRLLKEFEQMQDMMKKMKGGGLMKMSRALKVSRSSSFSPTPMKYTGIGRSSRAMAPARRPWRCRRAW